MAQPHKGDRRQITCTVPAGTLDSLDRRTRGAGLAERNEYLSALITEFLNSPAPIVLAPWPDRWASEAAKVRVPAVHATALARYARACGTTATALLRSIIFRDLELETSGSAVVVGTGQGVLPLQLATSA